MGADQFMDYAKGSTAQKAFNKAVKEAQYESGHGGYTGTIAEKSSFVMLDADREAERLIEQLQESLQYLTVKGQKELKKRVDRLWEDERAYGLSEREERTLDQLEQLQVTPWHGVSMADACKARRTRVREQIKKLKTKKHRARIIVDTLLDTDCRRFGKWDPAGCIQVKAGEFIFFGWASC